MILPPHQTASLQSISWGHPGTKLIVCIVMFCADFSFQKPPHSFECGPSCCSSHHWWLLISVLACDVVLSKSITVVLCCPYPSVSLVFSIFWSALEISCVSCSVQLSKRIPARWTTVCHGRSENCYVCSMRNGDWARKSLFLRVSIIGIANRIGVPCLTTWVPSFLLQESCFI